MGSRSVRTGIRGIPRCSSVTTLITTKSHGASSLRPARSSLANSQSEPMTTTPTRHFSSAVASSSRKSRPAGMPPMSRKTASSPNLPGMHLETLAEGEGFEPPKPFRVQRFSRPPPSTTRPSLRERRFVSVTGSVRQPIGCRLRGTAHVPSFRAESRQWQASAATKVAPKTPPKSGRSLDTGQFCAYTSTLRRTQLNSRRINEIRQRPTPRRVRFDTDVVHGR
jgi:hypothetical protein